MRKILLVLLAMMVMLVLLMSCSKKELETNATDINWEKFKKSVARVEIIPQNTDGSPRDSIFIFKDAILSRELKELDRVQIVLKGSGEADAVVWWDFWRVAVPETLRKQIILSLVYDYRQYLRSLANKDFQASTDTLNIRIVSKLPVEGWQSLTYTLKERR